MATFEVYINNFSNLENKEEKNNNTVNEQVSYEIM